MKIMFRLTAALLTLFAAASTHASLINFDDQGLTGPCCFAFASPSPQTLNLTVDGVTATFTGGVILDNTSALPANQTALYGTAYFGTGLSNPLTVTFSSAVHNLVFDVLNGLTTTQSFVVTDNLGNTSSFSLPPNLSLGATTIGLISDATSFTINQANGSSIFDFFVDNIQFNVDANCGRDGCTTGKVPEPATLVLASLALLGVGAARRRRA